jgi:hypothetical protein
MHLPQQQRISLTLVTALATLVAALAAAAIAATPGYAMPADAGGQVAPVRSAVADVRSPDRQAPAPEPAGAKVVFTGSASTTDALGPEDGVSKPVTQLAENGPPTWPQSPTSLPSPVSASSDSDGFELGSAAVGGAGVLAIGLLGLMAYAMTTRRRPVAIRH